MKSKIISLFIFFTCYTLAYSQCDINYYVNGDTNNLCVIEGDTVSLNYSTDVGWYIKDSNGIQIQSFFSPPGTNSLTLTNLSSGLYN